MSLNDISLTSGMRANLVSLQQTGTLLNRTQQRLSTGKAVNSALDNPINYFAAQGHMSRAADIASYKDGMAEAVQTIQTANQGITSLQGLIQAAKSLGQSALAANPNQIGFTLSSVASGDVITVGGQGFTAVQSNATGLTQFNTTDSDGNALSQEEIAANLTAKINANTETGSYGDIKAVNSGSLVTIHSAASDKTVSDTSVVSGPSGHMTVDTTVTSARNDLALQYENLLTQIDTLASTAGYQGTNLLGKDTLSVNFEGGALSVKGFSATSSDLGVNTAGVATSTFGSNNKWAISKDINTDLVNIDKGLNKLNSEASNLSSSLSIINIQQDFSTQKVNILTDGANQLTAADTNEEGANMLMLQTRQSLGTTALSLSSQAAQSVLKLFA
jgi:flagellin-like hook-associated protein FlgL